MLAFAGGHEAYLQRYLLLIYRFKFRLTVAFLVSLFDAWRQVYILAKFMRELYFVVRVRCRRRIVHVRYLIC